MTITNSIRFKVFASHLALVLVIIGSLSYRQFVTEFDHSLELLTESHKSNSLAIVSDVSAAISGGNYEPVSGSKARRQVNQASNLMKDIHLTICTNWSTFSPKGGLSLGSNVKQLIHLPLKDMRYAPPSLISNLTIFAPWSNDIAVAVSGTQEMLDKFVHHPMVLREI